MDFTLEPTPEPMDATVAQALPRSEYEDATSALREPLRRLLIRGGDRAFLVSTESIEWIEADGHFVTLHLADQSYRIRTPLSALHAKLDRHQFLRVNRSTVVNFDFIIELHPRSQGAYDVLLRNGKVLSFSRLYCSDFKRLGATYDLDKAS